MGTNVKTVAVLGTAGGRQRPKTSLKEAKECSYFILMLGWRYGYVPEGEAKSVIELECSPQELPYFVLSLMMHIPSLRNILRAAKGQKNSKPSKNAFKNTT